MIDLKERYGRESLKMLEWCEDVKEFTRFFKDMALNSSKSIKLASKSSHRRKWTCADEKCSWVVILAKKKQGMRSNVNYKTKTTGIPVGAWYISSFNEHHINTCRSAATISKRQLTEMPALRKFIMENQKISLTDIAEILKADGALSSEMYSERTAYRASRSIKDSIAAEMSHKEIREDAK